MLPSSNSPASNAPEATLAAHERVYRTLRLRIMYGELDPGVSLTLRGIAGAFDVFNKRRSGR